MLLLQERTPVARKKVVSTIEDNLRSAAQLIEEKGWIQYQNKNHSGFCMHGAITDAVIMDPGNDHTYDRIYLIHKRLKARLDCTGITTWNDFPGRTKEEVVAALLEEANG